MQSKKGFTLVELLAVVVILGIIMTISIPAVSKWINRSKGESMDAQKQTLLLAGQSYAQGNSKVLPKAIGETVFIKATDLKKANYLKEDLRDSEKKSCMKDSIVRIYKYDKNGYSYTAYLYCEGDSVPNEIHGVEPIIGITFTGNNLKDEVLQDVSNTGFRVTIEGGKKEGKNLGIDGYTYSISVKYAGTGEVVEIFNSGSLNAGGKEKLVIEKSLGDYTKITTLSEFMITVEAYNRDGGYKKATANSRYGDTTPPVCGEITGQAGENQWFNSPHTSTISVKCSDEANGSGCTKEVFTKSWNTEIEDGVIQIKDNAGNTTDCTVRVHHDWTRPTLTITAHKNLQGNGKGDQAAIISANQANPTVTLSSYTGDYGPKHWLNYANFKNGVYYEITVSDNIHINTGQWYYNSPGINSESDSNINTMTTGSSKTFTKTDNKTYVTLTGEGMRRARYELTDKAGNKVTVNIQANIDKTHPGCTSSGGSSTWTNGNRTLRGTCSDSMSGCKENISKGYTSEINSTSETPGTVYDNANNSTTCPRNQTVRIDKTAPTCSARKNMTDVPHGLTIYLTCSDGASGVASCPCTVSPKGGTCVAEQSMKEGSKTYTVRDVAGNSGSCSVTVTKYIAYQTRTRSCSRYNYCSNSACGQCTDYSNCTSSTYSCIDSAGDSWTGSSSQCIYGIPCSCSKSCNSYGTKNCSCRTSGCGCETYTAWSAMSDFIYTSCTVSEYRECGWRYHWK